MRGLTNEDPNLQTYEIFMPEKMLGYYKDLYYKEINLAISNITNTKNESRFQSAVVLGRKVHQSHNETVKHYEVKVHRLEKVRGEIHPLVFEHNGHFQNLYVWHQAQPPGKRSSLSDVFLWFSLHLFDIGLHHAIHKAARLL